MATITTTTHATKVRRRSLASDDKPKSFVQYDDDSLAAMDNTVTSVSQLIGDFDDSEVRPALSTQSTDSLQGPIQDFFD